MTKLLVGGIFVFILSAGLFAQFEYMQMSYANAVCALICVFIILLKDI